MMKGIAASPGISIGKAFIFEPDKLKLERKEITEDGIAEEIIQFKEAIERTKKELIQVKKRVMDEVGEEYAKIFSAHLLVLEDPFLIIEVERKIKEERINVEYALFSVLETLTSSFSSLDDEYIKERAVDIHDIGRRLLGNLLKQKRVNLELEESRILVGHNLTPSHTAQLNKEKILAFVTDMGGRTSHTAILARAMEIPAVVGLINITSLLKEEDTLIVDGNRGEVVIKPTPEVIEEYSKRKKEYELFITGLANLKDLPAQTKDGFRIELCANIEIPEEVDLVKEHGSEGIGLYRTEFLYLGRNTLPNEDEQEGVYKEVARKTFPYSVIIRTLDLGGDKLSLHLKQPEELESNPFLGLRAIRLCLANVDIFKTQLRAILKASVYGNIKIIFPMISNLEELIKTKEILREVQEELRRENIPFDEAIEIGVMIETPAACMIADMLAEKVDFFSIGTNDLIQYTIAVDRGNERIAHLYEPLHPAILRLIKLVIEAAHRRGKWVGMCGEMAGDPLSCLVLLGLGLDEFSMSGVVIPEIKEIIRSVTLSEAKEIATEVSKLDTAQEVKSLIRKRFSKKLDKVLLRSENG
ncbi:MAG: phosphoenolpyruvate--protein phosphotransferase [bacterium]|nr:phosphoenolpyruvate--protein phosphotransferase [bacterium]